MFRWLVAAAICVAVIPSARAQSAGATHKGKLAGKSYLFTLPPGWTATDSDTGVNFLPPPGRVRGDFGCFVASFPGGVGGRSAVQFAKDVAATHKKDHMPWADITEPDEFNFMGVPAALITVGGVNPSTKVQEASMFLLAPGDNVIYAFVAAGRLDDLQDNAQDLVGIINGVRADDGKAAPAPGTPGGGCVGFGCASGAPPAVADPPWGLEVAGLSDKWVVRAVKNSYVFTAKGGPQITVRHLWPDNPEFVAARKTAQKSKLGRHAALVVDGKNKRSWYLEVGKLVTVVDLAATDVASAEAQVMDEFVEAFTLARRDFAHRNDAKRSMRVAMANGVSYPLANGWFFNDVGARGAAFGVKVGAGFALVQVRTAKVAKGADAFAEDLQAVELQCKIWKGKPVQDKVDVPGTGLSRRLRCEPTSESLKELRPWYVLVLERGKTQVFLFGTSTDAKIKPDDRVDEMARRIDTLD
jgi:hypothetical protein